MEYGNREFVGWLLSYPSSNWLEQYHSFRSSSPRYAFQSPGSFCRSSFIARMWSACPWVRNTASTFSIWIPLRLVTTSSTRPGASSLRKKRLSHQKWSPFFFEDRLEWMCSWRRRYSIRPFWSQYFAIKPWSKYLDSMFLLYCFAWDIAKISQNNNSFARKEIIISFESLFRSGFVRKHDYFGVSWWFYPIKRELLHIGIALHFASCFVIIK